jgi:hypothetical protein
MDPRVPDRKPWELEPIAQRFLSEYWSPSEQWVDIETIIERDLDILIDYSSCDCLPAIGAIGRRVSDGRFVIVVSEELADRNPNRYRFTLAQEASHFLLHRGLLESVTSLEEAADLHVSLSPGDYDRLESSANWCAGAILTPQHQFRDAAHDAYALWFARIKEKAGIIVPDFLVKRIIDDLAKSYRVSFQAAKIRLQRWPIKLYDDVLESARRSQPNIGSGWQGH